MTKDNKIVWAWMGTGWVFTSLTLLPLIKSGEISWWLMGMLIILVDGAVVGPFAIILWFIVPFLIGD